MTVLGISGRTRHAAAAIVVDGRVVAAVTEESVARVIDIGYAHSAGLPFGAVAACLKRAGLAPAAVDLVAVEASADEDLDAIRARWGTSPGAAGLQVLASCAHTAVDGLWARAAQALAIVGPGSTRIVVLDLDGAGCGAIFAAAEGRLTKLRAIAGMNGLAGTVAEMTRRIGCPGVDLAAIQGLADTGMPLYLAALQRAVSYRDGAIDASAADLALLLDGTQNDVPGPLSEPAPIHVAVRNARARLASSLLTHLSELAGVIVSEASAGGEVVVSGGLFESPALVRAVQARVPAMRVVPVPGRFGAAIGAAIHGSGPVPISLPAGLALGPIFSEPDVKEVLDGCRLDYVYEPDWPRLLPRVSRMLGRGKQIAWFQGPMEFGSRSLGGRSILGDPSSRYTRDNINRYLRHRPDDQPPPLVMLAASAADCLVDYVASPLAVGVAQVREAWRPRLQACVDASGACRVHTVEAGASRLGDLLAVHASLSGIPALAQVDLRGLDEATACSPRDAIRTTFSCPVDALVIERFLLMKDYWLLRSAAE